MEPLSQYFFNNPSGLKSFWLFCSFNQ